MITRAFEVERQRWVREADISFIRGIYFERFFFFSSSRDARVSSSTMRAAVASLLPGALQVQSRIHEFLVRSPLCLLSPPALLPSLPLSICLSLSLLPFRLSNNPMRVSPRQGGRGLRKSLHGFFVARQLLPSRATKKTEARHESLVSLRTGYIYIYIYFLLFSRTVDESTTRNVITKASGYTRRYISVFLRLFIIVTLLFRERYERGRWFGEKEIGQIPFLPFEDLLFRASVRGRKSSTRVEK